eukprot:Amastigsp_a847082_19.p4 type:complete len:110 gc:universal Amastigsp_a847082_19:423-752(+)
MSSASRSSSRCSGSARRGAKRSSICICSCSTRPGLLLRCRTFETTGCLLRSRRSSRNMSSSLRSRFISSSAAAISSGVTSPRAGSSRTRFGRSIICSCCFRSASEWGPI